MIQYFLEKRPDHNMPMKYDDMIRDESIPLWLYDLAEEKGIHVPTYLGSNR